MSIPAHIDEHAAAIIVKRMADGRERTQADIVRATGLSARRVKPTLARLSARGYLANDTACVIVIYSGTGKQFMQALT